MALNQTQIELVQEFRSRLREDLQAYATAPEVLTEPLKELWSSFKEVAEFEDDNQADLAAFGALAQFAVLVETMNERDLKELLSLFSLSILTMVRKGDRLD